MDTQQIAAEAETTGSAPVSTETQTEETKAVETTESATVESSETTEDKGSEPKDEDKRTKELIAQRRAKQKAIEEAAYWRGKAEALEAMGKKPTEKPSAPAELVRPVKPRVSQFETVEAFEQAEAQYEEAYEAYVIAKAEQVVAKKTETTTQTSKLAEIHEAFMAKVEEATALDPDFKGTVTSLGSKIPDYVGMAIKESDDPVQVILYLDQNPKETARIARMTPTAAAKEIGKIEVALATKTKTEPVKKVSTAPEPVKTVSSVGPTSVDIGDLPMDEYIKVMNEKQGIGRRGK